MHKSNVERRWHKGPDVATYGMFFLFPGFYFYNILLATGNVPAIAGGYFAVISVILLVIFSFKIRQTILLGTRRSGFFWLFIGFILWCSLLAFLSLLTGHHPENQQAFIQVAETIALWLVFFHLGLYVDLSQQSLKSLFWVSGLLILTNIIYYVATTGSYFFYVKEFYDASDKVAVYQGFSRSALVTAFVCLANIRFRGAQLLALILVSFFCLFILGSRSELVAFVFIAGIIFFSGFIKSPAKMLLPTLGLMLVLVAIIFSYEGFSGSRQMELLNLEESSSWQARSDLSSKAIDRIIESPVFGEIGGHFLSGEEGAYAHNILSSWDAFGIIGFFMYLLLISIPAASATLLMFGKHTLSSNEKFFIFMALSMFLLSLAAKSVYSALPAIAWGLYVGVKKTAIVTSR